MPTDNQPLTPPVAPAPEEPCCRISHKTAVIIALIVIGLLLVGSAVYAAFYFSKSASLNPSATKNVVTPAKTVTASPSAATDPTAGWKTYSGKEYSFKYPANWSYRGYDANGGHVTVYDKSSKDLTENDVYGVIDIYHEAGRDSLPVQNYIPTFKLTDPAGLKINSGKTYVEEKLNNVSVSGIESVEQRISNLNDANNKISPGLIVVATHNGQNLFFRSYYDNGKTSVKILDHNFDLILSTFKFLDVGTGTSGDTSSWKSYQKNGVSFKYPTNYNIEDRFAVLAQTAENYKNILCFHTYNSLDLTQTAYAAQAQNPGIHLEAFDYTVDQSPLQWSQNCLLSAIDTWHTTAKEFGLSAADTANREPTILSTASVTNGMITALK
ncbi:MAG: hypothetical protein NT141_00775, partial [candidate division WWE3 bacterium]|nr:hypothetical protein [candidate division WWE3 bacterium]